MEYMIAAYTDVGIQKANNQDGFCVRRAALSSGGEMTMAVVCDGMGGLEKGELASAEVVRAFGGWFDQNMARLPSLCAQGFAPVRVQWEELIFRLHERLLAYSQAAQVRLGTTLVAWLALGERYLAVNIGDSRLYEHRGQLCQITQDQSLVAREIALGHITEEQAAHHPQRNVLLQCLGTGATVSPVFQEGKVYGGAVYLLCSDGFVHQLSRPEMEQRLLPIRLGSREVMTQALAEMIGECKAQGETDNITAVLVKASESRFWPARSGGRRGLLGRRKQAAPAGLEPEAVLVETAQIVYTEDRIG